MASISIRWFSPILLVALLIAAAIALLTSSVLLVMTMDDASDAAQSTIDEVWREANLTLEDALESSHGVTKNLTRQLADATAHELAGVVGSFFGRYNLSVLVLEQMIRHLDYRFLSVRDLENVINVTDVVRRVAGEDRIPTIALYSPPVNNTYAMSGGTGASRWALPSYSLISTIGPNKGYNVTMLIAPGHELNATAPSAFAGTTPTSGLSAIVTEKDTFSWVTVRDPASSCSVDMYRDIFGLAACGTLPVHGDGTPPFNVSGAHTKPYGLLGPWADAAAVPAYRHFSKLMRDQNGYIVGRLTHAVHDDNGTHLGTLALSLRLDDFQMFAETSTEVLRAAQNTTGDAVLDLATAHAFVIDSDGILWAAHPGGDAVSVVNNDTNGCHQSQCGFGMATSTDGPSLVQAVVQRYASRLPEIARQTELENVTSPLSPTYNDHFLMSVLEYTSLGITAKNGAAVDGTTAPFQFEDDYKLYFVVLINETEVFGPLAVRRATLRAEFEKNETEMNAMRRRQIDEESSQLTTTIVIQVVVTVVTVVIVVLLVFVVTLILDRNFERMIEAISAVEAMDLDAAEEILTGIDRSKTAESAARPEQPQLSSPSPIAEVWQLQNGVLHMITTLREYRRYLPAWLKDQGDEEEENEEEEEVDQARKTSVTGKPQIKGKRPGSGGTQRSGRSLVSKRSSRVGRRGVRRPAVGVSLLTQIGLNPKKVSVCFVALPIMRNANDSPYQQLLEDTLPPPATVTSVFNEALTIGEKIVKQHRATVAPDVTSSLGGVPAVVFLSNAEIVSARPEPRCLEIAVDFLNAARESDNLRRAHCIPFMSVVTGPCGAGSVGTAENRWFMVVSSVLMRARALTAYAMARQLPIVCDEVTLASDVTQSNFQYSAIDVVGVRSGDHEAVAPEPTAKPFGSLQAVSPKDGTVICGGGPERFVVMHVEDRQSAAMEEWMYELEEMDAKKSKASPAAVAEMVCRALWRCRTRQELEASRDHIVTLQAAAAAEGVNPETGKCFTRLAAALHAVLEGKAPCPYTQWVHCWAVDVDAA
eukprot:TRINITY_DN777_c0_g2_i1.p1 TRINITY_DN777_c0_g2~~TRINITY_DN777_c0_g2_i1.p1  ORF type:complete len:1103 (-),score=261.91 TRINITY_DN777_c0_g2_i1:2938-6066(-)